MTPSTLAHPSCALCEGTGFRDTESQTVCRCVHREVFRVCLAKVRECSQKEHSVFVCKQSHPAVGNRRAVLFSFPPSEFIADFCNVAKRALSSAEHQVFRFRYLLGADWKMCCTRLQMNRAKFFVICEAIESKLGQRFAELEPYPLYPVEGYFGPSARQVMPCVPPPAARPLPVRAPLQRSVR